jgi:hypothetical protein
VIRFVALLVIHISIISIDGRRVLCLLELVLLLLFPVTKYTFTPSFKHGSALYPYFIAASAVILTGYVQHHSLIMVSYEGFHTHDKWAPSLESSFPHATTRPPPLT